MPEPDQAPLSVPFFIAEEGRVDIAGTSKEGVARKYGVRGANFIAFKD